MTKDKKDYPDPDLVFKGVRVMWARTKEDNPYPASKGTKANGATFRTAERWSFDIVLNDAQAEVAKAKQAYVKTKTDAETGETYHFLNLSRNTKNFEGLKVAPFFIVDKDTGDRIDVEMANGTIMDVEIYLGDDINEQSGARKARLKRGVVTELIPYVAGSGEGGASVNLPDSSEQAAPVAKTTAKPKAASKAKVESSDLEDDIPFNQPRAQI